VATQAPTFSRPASVSGAASNAQVAARCTGFISLNATPAREGGV
jgi:hypothetical protein